MKEKVQSIKTLEEENRKEVEELHRKLLDNEMMWKEELREALNRKEIEI
jgi:hypothetical protein